MALVTGGLIQQAGKRNKTCVVLLSKGTAFEAFVGGTLSAI